MFAAHANGNMPSNEIANSNLNNFNSVDAVDNHNSNLSHNHITNGSTWPKMIKYPRTTSSNSSGFFEDDELMYQTPPQSPAQAPAALQRHMVRMFSSEE